ncbi:MAG: phosphoenolpyruvate synthase, partial [Lysobacterales bacterium]
MPAEAGSLVVALASVGLADVPRVGGKNASLGELIRHLSAAGVRVVGGFATTVAAYRDFIAANDLGPEIARTFERRAAQALSLAVTGRRIRQSILRAELSDALAAAVLRAYRELRASAGGRLVAVAVRSSATAEDLPDASFAGQQETFLNVRGEAALLDACRRCFASLYTDRAISYRDNHGIDQLKVALSVGVQPMVRSDRGAAGVMFSIDTETGFPGVVVIDGSFGLGETVVQGSVDPDSYRVFKPLLADERLRPVIERRRGRKQHKLVYGRSASAGTRLVKTSRKEREAYVLETQEILELARWAVKIESHYGRPMDIEWAKDGRTGELFVLQARPETVQTQRATAALKTYEVKNKGRQLVSGVAVGDGVGTGRVCRLKNAKSIARFEPGSILVTSITDPDWVPIMKRAAGIVTDHGGRTSHAAIVSRELGLPAIVGTGSATRVLRDGQAVTVSCAEGNVGAVYAGIADVTERNIDIAAIPATHT